MNDDALDDLPPDDIPDDAEGDADDDADVLPSTRVYVIRAAPNAQRIRLDQCITRSVENASRNKVQQLVEAGGVTVNGIVVLKPGRLVLPGDEVVCTVPKPPPPEIVAEDIPLEIAYEDDDVLVVNKPAMMVTHPAHGNYSGTLVNALMHYTTQLSRERGDDRPGILHRLDKGTSGLLCVAKNERAHTVLAAQFSDHSIEREYWAVVWGSFKNSTGSIDLPLARHKSDRKKMAVVEGGKEAVTGYEVLRSFGHLSLLRLRLRTGRTHQIRVHLSHLHHPVFGDPTYGGRRILYGSVTQRYKQFIEKLLDVMPRQALHARTLGFVHPVTRERVFVESALPADMQLVLDRLEEYFGA
ncbi:MAG: RluA family pseudouridine synthase [Ignavibacteria bacterium]|nr:RluA family pseudouridine synthase [Ignavibacteria bacterium]